MIAPWFINWDDYKSSFEAEAEKILGRPVRVLGSADARILPSPSLTFTDVEVGEAGGKPMMSVERFQVTIEMMPLIQGEIRIIAMSLERPVVRVGVDQAGTIDWLVRGEPSQALDPDNIVLEGVHVTDGTIVYHDAGTGIEQTVTGVRATAEARSLAGPWRVVGSFVSDDAPVQFEIATGRRLEDGTIRMRLDLTPARLPVFVAADGIVGLGEDGLSYAGTYALTQITASEADGEPGDTQAWRSEGSFTLTRDRLVVDRAVLSEGPADRPSSLAGSMTLDIGREPHFTARLEARQLDLDRTLGKGPTKPVEVGVAASRLVGRLSALPVPPIPGEIDFNVPAIVVGGAVIQDLRFRAAPGDGGWQITGLEARLPGQAAIAADGRLSTGANVGFGGAVRLSVGQPATFAAWWRGGDRQGAGRLLAPFELAGRAVVTPTALAVDGMTAVIDEATVTGSFSWTDSEEEATLRTDLAADRLDFVQVEALAEMLAGQDLADVTALADNYEIKLTADELRAASITMQRVAVDAAFSDGSLRVSGITVEDIGGARLNVTRGQIDDVLTRPRGRLEAQLNAASLAGLAVIADRMIPDTPFARWFRSAAPSLSPAAFAVVVDSSAMAGDAHTRVEVTGSLAATNFDVFLDLASAPAAWRVADISAKASLTSYDAVGLIRQSGLTLADVGMPGGARFELAAEGTPAEGLEARAEGRLGDNTVTVGGKLRLAAGEAPSFSGDLDFESADVEPLLAVAGAALPLSPGATPADISAKLETVGTSARLAWTKGAIGDRRVDGDIRITEAVGADLEATGSLHLDRVDLGWLLALGLGASPLPTGNPEAPWSPRPFSGPSLHGLIAKLQVGAERLNVGDAFSVANAALDVSVAPDRLGLDVRSGDAAGGTVAGGVSVRNIAGNVSLTGRFSLVDAALESLVWQRAGRAVATGKLDVTADFEATGQSPAALISSLTGGGTLAIRDGAARYVNPRAVALVVRGADLGQEYTEDALRDVFEGYIDAGSLRFAGAEAPFSIAAGTIRLANLTAQSGDAVASGSAAIDLNSMTIDSDWDLRLDLGGDDESGNPPPQIGVVFRGPLAAPTRSLDVLQFNAYLNIRREERLQQILALEQAALLEKERLGRELRKFRQDAERRERLAEERRAALAAAATRLETLHVVREVHAEERAAAELAAARERARQAAEALAAAVEAAEAARARAENARQSAADAGALAAKEARSLDRARDLLVEATAKRRAAETAAVAATRRAEELDAASTAAANRGAAAAAAEEDAAEALARARDAHDAEVAEASAAEARAETATEAAATAGQVAEAAAAAAREAAADADNRLKAADEARTASEQAEATRRDAEALAASQARIAAVGKERSAGQAAEAEEAAAAATAAAEKAATAAADRDESMARANVAEAEAERARAAQSAAEDLLGPAMEEAAARRRQADAAADEASRLQATAEMMPGNAARGVIQAAERRAADAQAEAERRRDAASAAEERVLGLRQDAAESRDAAVAAEAAAAEARRDADTKTAAAAAAHADAEEAKVAADTAATLAEYGRVAADRSAADAESAALGAQEAADAAAVKTERLAELDAAAAAAVEARQSAASDAETAAAERSAAERAAARAANESQALLLAARAAKAEIAKAETALSEAEARSEAAVSEAAGARQAAETAREEAAAAAKAEAAARTVEVEAEAAVAAAQGEWEAARKAAADAVAVAEAAEADAETAARKVSAMSPPLPVPGRDAAIKPPRLRPESPETRAEAVIEPVPALAVPPASFLPTADRPLRINPRPLQ